VTRHLQGFRKFTLGIAMVASTLLITACGGSGSIYEIEVNMASIGLNLEERFGLDVQINDDDGGDRDSKLAWFAPPNQDESWKNPS